MSSTNCFKSCFLLIKQCSSRDLLDAMGSMQLMLRRLTRGTYSSVDFQVLYTEPALTDLQEVIPLHVFYRVVLEPRRVEILHIWHSSRRFPVSKL